MLLIQSILSIQILCVSDHTQYLLNQSISGPIVWYVLLSGRQWSYSRMLQKPNCRPWLAPAHWKSCQNESLKTVHRSCARVFKILHVDRLPQPEESQEKLLRGHFTVSVEDNTSAFKLDSVCQCVLISSSQTTHVFCTLSMSCEVYPLLSLAVHVRKLAPCICVLESPQRLKATEIL